MYEFVNERETELFREYEWHGRELVPHLLVAFELVWGGTKSSIERKLAAIEDALEHGWSLLDWDRGSLPLIMTVGDGYEAYVILKTMGNGPPTMRLFQKLFLLSPAMPELENLRRAEQKVLGLQRRGRGPRACRDCYLNWLAGVVR